MDNLSVTSGLSNVSTHMIPPAVSVRHLQKSYGTNKVLTDMCMTVAQGSIYGLLGSSGCGKSTFLKIITGRLAFQQGTVQVFGSAPGAPGHQVPGSLIGYMPQDIALFGDFTIAETLEFYGRLHSMPLDIMKERRDFLISFLNLPDPDRLVKVLSGGQQRRVSLAVAMIHQPKLLILDEPTVGVDPLLRIRIWDYLVQIARSGVSIIITTHYITETMQADRVGLMRGGRLLAEGKPLDLIRKFRQETLEDVFLQLCHQQPDDEGSNNLVALKNNRPNFPVGGRNSINAGSPDDDVSSNASEDFTTPNFNTPLTASPRRGRSNSDSSTRSNGMSSSQGVPEGSPRMPFCGGPPIWRTVWTLLWKNWIICARNIPFLIFQFILPALQVLLFCLAIGDDPKGLKMAVVNQDVGVLINLGSGQNTAFPNVYSTNPFATVPDFFSPASSSPFTSPAMKDPPPLRANVFVSFSKSILDNLDTSSIKKVTYASEAEAEAAVRRGDVWGVIRFYPYFSQDLLFRCGWSGNANSSIVPPASGITDEILRNGTLMLNMDNTDEQISATIQAKVNAAFMYGVATDLVALQAAGVKVNSAVVRPVVQLVLPPVYGVANPKFTDFIAPGIIISISFAQAIGLTAMAVVMAKKEGTLDRQWASGVRPSEVMVSHVITQIVMLLIQTLMLLFVALVIFKLPMHGNFGLLLLMTQLLGMAGMLYGLFLSSICADEEQAVQYSNGSVFPVMLLSGILWPVEGIPLGLRYVAYSLPTTWASSALRDIMERGYGLEHDSVWQGFLIVIGWGVLFLMLSSRGFQSRD